MFRAPWVCRHCVSLLKAGGSNKLQIRLASTSNGISPTLLTRARNMSLEHDTLSAQTAETFDAKIAKRIGELSSIRSALKEWEEASLSLEELNALIADPQTDEELRELAAEDLLPTTNQLETISTALTTALTPKHPFAELPCLLEIRPGVGGGEANLFAGDLLRMYQAYCSRKGLKVSVLKYEDAEGASDASGEAPLAEAILEIENSGAYADLRCESGVHRVQRVPATESKGRTHTSAVSVLVLPSFPTNVSEGQTLNEADLDDPTSDYYVNPQDVRTDVMRARGAGGQHVNTTDSAVRLTHIPSGTVVSMQDSRSQHKNREKAWQLLRSRLAQQRRDAREEEMQTMRKSIAGVSKTGRGDKVRTYNWGQQRVTDHRSGLSVHDLDDVLEGGMVLEKLMESVRGWMADQDIKIMIADEEMLAEKEKKDKKK